jgi:hypothetical protein
MITMTRPQLIEFFNEHVRYELFIMRHTSEQLESDKLNQLDWNIMFSAFNVSARNIYEFLRGKKGNVCVTQYRPFCRQFQHSDIDDVRTLAEDLNAQCFHMGEDRKMPANGKVTIAKIQTLARWLESNMSELERHFDDDFRTALQSEYERQRTLSVSAENPTSSAAVSIVSTGSNT